MRSDDGKQVIPLEKLASRLVPGKIGMSHTGGGQAKILAYVKKNEHPRTWLCTKLSEVFSDPKSSIGSAHKISHIMPCVGGSRKRSIYANSENRSRLKVGRLTARMSSKVFNSGDRPPCMHKNCLFMTAANGSAQKDSIHASYTRSLYLCLPTWNKCMHCQCEPGQLTFEFEGEIVCQMSAFMISAQQK